MRFLKPGWLIMYLLLGVSLWAFLTRPIPLDTTVFIKQGQSVRATIAKDMGRRHRTRLWWAFRGNDAVTTIQPGQYIFSGAYTPTEIVDLFVAGPTSAYQRVTLLEGWNKWDIDTYLQKELALDPGSYLAYISDPIRIQTYVEKYPFLRQAVQERGTLASLEGYLYPETYMLDTTKDLLDQLVYLQLEAFYDRIRVPYGEQLASLTARLSEAGYTFPLSSYGALTLASIIEKEESVDANKPLIASIFFNRLSAGMRLDADISLCYGFQEPYETCTPTRIVAHLQDKENLYNTRARTGLPPTPISTVHASSIQAILTAPKTDYLFYLHNKKGEIFPAKTNAEHNINKSKEL